MKWLKHVVLDLAVTAMIVLAAPLNQTWAGWIVLGYTPLMLALKAFAAFGPSLAVTARKPAADPVPAWFHHLLYAVNVVTLFAAGWKTVAALWAVIWVLSWLAESKVRPTTATA